MKIALCQTSSKTNKAENLEEALRLLDEAATKNVDVAMLPECLDFMGPQEDIYKNSEEAEGPMWTALANKAKELGIWVIGGTLRIREEGESLVGNTMIIFNPKGELVDTYKKLHMFDITIPGEVNFLESASVKKGEELVLTEIAGVPSGLSICFDLRFPELFRLYAMAGAKVLFLPAAFTAFTGAAHWETLLKARAIENVCFVVACNQTGEYTPGNANYGHSMVIDPWGRVLADAGSEVGVTVVDIDLDEIEKTRKLMPSLANRRDDIYDIEVKGAFKS